MDHLYLNLIRLTWLRANCNLKSNRLHLTCLQNGISYCFSIKTLSSLNSTWGNIWFLLSAEAWVLSYNSVLQTSNLKWKRSQAIVAMHWWTYCEAVRSAGNHLKRLVVPHRSAEDVAVGNDPGGAVEAETDARSSVVTCCKVMRWQKCFVLGQFPSSSPSSSAKLTFPSGDAEGIETIAPCKLS